MQSLNSTPVRAAIAVLLIAGIAAGVLLIREGDGNGDAATTTPAAGTSTPAAYTAPVYYLCDDATAEANGILPASGPPVIGEPAPDFALCDETGAYLTKLSDMRDRVVWLNFWATWCVPCKRELPDIQALHDEFKDAGLDVLIINYQESAGTALDFLPRLGISMPAVIDREGAIYEDYRLTGLPDSFWVGRDGNVATLYYGFITEEIARNRLEALGLASDETPTTGS
jgi:thiol-disulfide isomerase/thioredoxin